MRKEIIICVIVILLVVIVNIITQNYTSKTVEIMDANLAELRSTIENSKDDEIITKNVETTFNIWKDRYEKLAYYIEHDELEKVETELTSMKTNIEIEQYEEAIDSLEKSIFILNHINEKFRFRLKNIF